MKRQHARHARVTTSDIVIFRGNGVVAWADFTRTRRWPDGFWYTERLFLEIRPPQSQLELRA